MNDPRVVAAQSADGKIEQIGAIEYREKDGRVWLVFPCKPADEIRAALRVHGFNWIPTLRAWVRQLSEEARYHARKIAEQAGAETSRMERIE